MTQHLTEVEIRRYRERTLSPDELLQASDHVAECELCRHRTTKPEELAGMVGKLRQSLDTAHPRHLTYQELSDYVDGALSAADTASAKSHLDNCEQCATEIANLRAIQAELLPAPAQAKPAASAKVLPFPAKTKPRSRVLVWAASAASVAALIAGSGVWRYSAQHAPGALLAAAYTEARPFEYRLGDQGYSPVRQHRAAEGISALDKSNSLQQAEIKINRELKDAPDAPALLMLRGRAQLLELEYDHAIESLTRAQELKPNDAEVLAELGCAYALRAQAQNRLIDDGRALDLLRQSLVARPGQTIALFNLALVCERVGLFDEAAQNWQQFLLVERDGGWAKEARQHLADIETRKKKRDQARQGVKPDPAAFLSLAHANRDTLNAELFQDVAWKDWFPRMTKDAEAKEAFHVLAQIFATRLHDTSLADAWSLAGKPEDTGAAQELSQAMAKNGSAQFDAALPLARAAAESFARHGNSAASLRAQVETAISTRRSSANNCLAITGPLIGALERTSYLWMRGQALLEQGACHNMAGELELAEQDLRRASATLLEGPFAILQLRAQGFLGALSLDKGDLQAVWENNDEGLRKCWQFGAPPARAQQFDYDLGEACKRLELHQAESIFARASVRELSLTAAKPIEIFARVSAAPDLAEAKRELERAEGLLGGPNASATDRDELFAARLAYLERAPPELSNTRAELQKLEPVVQSSTADSEDRTRFAQAMGRSFAAAGDIEDATKNFHQAIAERQLDLQAVADPLARLARTERTEPAYKGLIDIQLARKSDAATALATWDAYRSSWLRGGATQTAAALPASVARLVYLALPEGVAAFSVRGTAITGQILKTPAHEIQQVQQRFARACSRPDSDLAATRKDGRQLYLWLIEPFLTNLLSAKMLLIDADGWLAGVPFPALVAANGRYLVEDFALAMSGAPSLNTRPDERLSSHDRALIVAVPAPGGNMPALPFALQEAQRVAARLPQATLLSEAAASLSGIKTLAPNARLFHFVGHGWSNAGDGGLIFPPRSDAAEPTHLSAAALSHLNFKACSLVVLSACMTGTGEVHGPFNPRSLVRAFLASGARRVVAARWNFDDAATATLMNHFYKGVVGGSALPAEALALAERAILGAAEYQHPFYWAAFAEYGEP